MFVNSAKKGMFSKVDNWLALKSCHFRESYIRELQTLKCFIIYQYHQNEVSLNGCFKGFRVASIKLSVQDEGKIFKLHLYKLITTNITQWKSFYFKITTFKGKGGGGNNYGTPGIQIAELTLFTLYLLLTESKRVFIIKTILRTMIATSVALIMFFTGVRTIL